MVRSAAVQGDIAEVWGKLNEIDPAFTLSPNDKITHQKLTPNILSLMKHCCHQRDYFFDVVMKIVTSACHQDFNLISFCSWIICQTQCLAKMDITRNFLRLFELLL